MACLTLFLCVFLVKSLLENYLMWFFKKHSLVLQSNSKINLSLRVLDRKEDSYHNLEMVTLPLALHDVIEMSLEKNNYDTYITCDDIGLSNMHHNLCTKAVDAMRRAFGFKDNFNISIHKEIPFAAGLGGGSSNAAAVMKGIVSLLDIKTDAGTLDKIGTSIGADVPFFLHGESALVEGIGEVLTPIKVKKSYWVLLVKPKEGLSTKAVFEKCDAFVRTPIETKNVLTALENGDDGLLETSIGNDLYEPACSILPKVKDIVDTLKAKGLPISSMTGSGSSCFAISDDVRKLKEVARYFLNQGCFATVTKTII